jgi:hypothetical protein
VKLSGQEPADRLAMTIEGFNQLAALLQPADPVLGEIRLCCLRSANLYNIR